MELGYNTTGIKLCRNKSSGFQFHVVFVSNINLDIIRDSVKHLSKEDTNSWFPEGDIIPDDIPCWIVDKWCSSYMEVPCIFSPYIISVETLKQEYETMEEVS